MERIERVSVVDRRFAESFVASRGVPDTVEQPAPPVAVVLADAIVAGQKVVDWAGSLRLRFVLKQSIVSAVELAQAELRATELFWGWRFVVASTQVVLEAAVEQVPPAR